MSQGAPSHINTASQRNLLKGANEQYNWFFSLFHTSSLPNVGSYLVFITNASDEVKNGYMVQTFSKKGKKGQGTMGAGNDIIRFQEQKILSHSSFLRESRQISWLTLMGV